ncbi:DCTN2 family protein [Megaselia abdita]
MVIPKFQNIPGIVFDQPDVYETPDVPEQETSDYYEEEPVCEEIERLHITTKDSFQRFKGKHLEGNVDFSDKIKKRFKGYEAWSTEYELVGVGEKETPVQKCRRLQCEMNELLDEVTSLQVDKQVAQEEKESYDAVASVITTAKKVLDSLRLEQVLGKEQGPAESKEIKSLISQVDEYKKSGVLTAIPTPGTDLAASARIAKLEHRLFKLEQSIGANPEKLSRLAASTGSSNLIEAVRQISTKAALLQPAHLDNIESRLGNLAKTMDTIAEKSSGSSQEAQRDHKVVELYEIAKRTEPISEVIPDMLERMKALESLHKYAMNFAKVLTEIQENQSCIASDLTGNKTVFKSVEKNFDDNLKKLNSEITKLDGRIKEVEGLAKKK